MYLQFSFLILSIYILAASASLREEPQAFCFQFTWLGPMKGELEANKTNCTILKNSPCFEPFVISATAPNTTELWLYNKDEYKCPLRSGFGCIKHVFIYNNAVINSTHFCGKMIEDQTSAVTSKCFSQEIDGHTIESCTCQSDPGARPCNSATINKYSFNFLSVLLLIQIIFS